MAKSANNQELRGDDRSSESSQSALARRGTAQDDEQFSKGEVRFGNMGDSPDVPDLVRSSSGLFTDRHGDKEDIAP